MNSTKLKSGTPYTLNNQNVWLHHDKQDGTATIRYCQSKYDAEKIDIVRVEDLKGVVKVKATPIKKVSVSKAKIDKVYLTLRTVFLENKPICEANLSGCTKRSTEIHHAAGRNKNTLDIKTWRALCNTCHRYVEIHPNEAKELGLSLNRL